MPQNDDLLSVAQVAAELNLTERAVRHRILSGSLTPAHKMPGRTGAYLLSRAEIERVKAGSAA